ncbi:Rv3235 family protein [Pengzhenrongella frigida]|uniref:Energy transducer TonB n=1 Tax=Pengzhenrongella frigida TaxID=1259133 RepID=A0A4Q5MX17_9MICO|nr:Rv3235 family protein [Cellulomonas sp. HLT2-17]RYV50178.1 energy transducer TonB [Cellulomonas sp. HLT2-17]
MSAATVASEPEDVPAATLTAAPITAAPITAAPVIATSAIATPATARDRRTPQTRVADAAAAPDVPDAPGRTTPARVRLTPLVEPAARVVWAESPAFSQPPIAGSAMALARWRPPGPDADSAGATERPRLPDPTKMCCAMVQAAVEALRGNRPLAQLARWVSPEVYEQLTARSALTQRVLGPGEATHRASIRRIRLFRLGEFAAEATVVVEDGPRVRAVAVRLEGHRGHWRATALEIG